MVDKPQAHNPKYSKESPRTTCTQGWAFTTKFQLGVNEPAPAGIMPESILRGIDASGYFIWRGSSPSTPQ